MEWEKVEEGTTTKAFRGGQGTKVKTVTNVSSLMETI